MQKIKVGEKCCVKKTTAVGYKVIELAKFTEDMKKEFYLVGESLLGNNAKKCNAQKVRNELSPTRSQCRKKILILYPVDYLLTYFSTYVFSHFVLLKVYPIKSILAKLGSFWISKLQEIGIQNFSLVSLFQWSHFF